MRITRLSSQSIHLSSNQTLYALSIGDFDGVHKGHRKLLEALNQTADRMGLTPSVLTFEPSPKHFLNPNTQARLMDLRSKAAHLSAWVNQLWVRRFSHTLAIQSAEDFLADLYALGVRALVLGESASLGAGGLANAEKLPSLCDQAGIQLHRVDLRQTTEQVISSTAIRSHLQAHKLALAEKMLGHPLAVVGRVRHGIAQARTLGFPTANLKLPKNTPMHGVYALSAWIEDRLYPAVGTVITKTWKGEASPVLEFHVPGQSLAIYSKIVAVAFHERLRDNQSFESPQALQAQIQKDVHQALASACLKKALDAGSIQSTLGSAADLKPSLKPFETTYHSAAQVRLSK